jgi:hypothetical protein
MKKRVNYDFERRKKELDRQRRKEEKKEEKLQRKQDAQRTAEETSDGSVVPGEGAQGSSDS